jgi:hypothetical protein
MDAVALQADFLRRVEPIVDAHSKRLDIVDKVLKEEKKRSINDFDKAFLATMYDNVNKEMNRYRQLKNIKKGSIADRVFSEQVGPYVKHIFNIITALYTTFDIKDLVSWQPMTQRRGAIYKMIYQFANTKGGINAGDIMFSPGQAAQRSKYYSSEIIKDETVVFTFATPDSIATLDYYPLQKPETISIVVEGGAAAGTYTYLSTTDGKYNVKKDAVEAKAGSIDPQTGILTLDGVDATGATGVTAAYTYSSEKFTSNSQIPRVTVTVTEEELRAERRNLLIDTMLDVSYDFESQFAASLNSEMENAVVQYLQNEMSFRVLGELFDGSTGNGGVNYTFNTNPTENVSLQEHAQRLYQLLATMSTKVRTNTGRGWGNKVVCGTNMLNFLKVLPQTEFVRAERPSGDGPYFAGTLNSDFDVYFNPDLGDSDFFMTYKGQSWWEAPYYIGSYLPLMKSDYLLYPDMHGEQGYLGLEAYSLEYPNMVVKGTVVTTPA